MKIKKIVWTKKFKKEFKKVKDVSVVERVEKQIKKIVKNPEVGKPLRYGLKGERTIYIKPFRLIYSVFHDKLFLLRFEHRKKVYR